MEVRLLLKPDKKAAIRTQKRDKQDRYLGEINIEDEKIGRSLEQLPAFWLGHLSADKCLH